MKRFLTPLIALALLVPANASSSEPELKVGRASVTRRFHGISEESNGALERARWISDSFFTAGVDLPGPPLVAAHGSPLGKSPVVTTGQAMPLAASK